MTQCELSSQQKKKAAVCKVCNDPEMSLCLENAEASK